MTSAMRSRATAKANLHPTFSILLATPGDATSIGAVRAAALLARRLHATVDVISVVTPFPHSTHPMALAASPESPAVIDEHNRHELVLATRAQLRQVRGTERWHVHAGLGWATDAIIAAAKRSNASLIVMGTGEHTPLARLVGGETAVGVAKRTATPILAVPANFSGRLHHAFAATDFSPSSTRAAQLAASLLAPRGTLTLLHTSAFAKATLEPGSFAEIYSTGVADRLAFSAKQIARATKRRVNTLLTEGTAPEAILAAVADGHGDLVAVGSHDFGVLERMVFGSVGASLLRHPPCPVLIVPRHAAAESE